MKYHVISAFRSIGPDTVVTVCPCLRVHVNCVCRLLRFFLERIASETPRLWQAGLQTGSIRKVQQSWEKWTSQDVCRESDGCEIQCDNVEFDIVCDTDNLVYVIVLSLLCDIICGYVVYFDRCNYSIIWIYAFMWERSSYFLPWPNSSVRATERVHG